MSARLSLILACGFVCIASARADRFVLLAGVDATRYPGAARSVIASPGPGFPGTFYDGDRLAGTPDVGPVVPFVGVGTPLFQPNQFGSLSLMYRRGSAPAGPGMVVPFLGIDFLGGPRLDLDGNGTDFDRSFVPTGQTPAQIPDIASFIELNFDLSAGSVDLLGIDATGTNEGGPGVSADIATVLVTIAGTEPNGIAGTPPNPTWDTRSGTTTQFLGAGGDLRGVYRIENLAFEMWQDSIDPNSSSADTLGTFQYFGAFRGWLVKRDNATGQFPTLAGQGLGSTLWPQVNAATVGQSYNTANGLAGGSAIIASGRPQDNFTVANNGGLALTAFGGDLGAYLDAVVSPTAAGSASYVYLESAGFGINNSFDPVFSDSVSYDVVIIAAQEACTPCDANCDGSVNLFDIQPFVTVLTTQEGCSPCSGDANNDGSINLFDIGDFVECLGD